MPNPTYDYELEGSDIARRQAIADALLKGGLVPMGETQMVSGRAVPQGLLPVLAKLMQAYAGQKQQSDLKSERAALSQRYSDDLRTGMEQFEKTSRGYQQPSMALEPNPDGTPQMQTVPGDRRKAILEAMASTHPMIRDFAMKQMAEEAKGAIGAKDLLAHADPRSIPAIVSQGVAGFQPKRDIKEAGGQFFDLTGDKPNAIGGVQFSKPYNIGPDLYQDQLGTGKVDQLNKAPRTNVTVNSSSVMKGESEFMKQIGEASAKDVIAAKQAKVAGQRQLQSLQKLEELEKNGGVMGGVLTTPAVFITGLADGLGMNIDKRKLSNSQAYQGEVMSQLSNQLTGSLARSTTDKDMEILKAPLPQLMMSPEGRAALRRQVAAKARENIEYADSVQQNLMQTYPEAGRLFNVTPGITPVPQRSDLGGQPKTIKWGDLP